MVRYGSRRRRRYNDSSRSSNNSILLVDFMFFNKTKKIIDDKVLKSLIKRIEQPEEKKIFWTNKELGDIGIGFEIYKDINYSTTPNSQETYIKILEFSDKKLNPEQFNNCKHIINNFFFLNFDISGDISYYLGSISLDDNEKIVNSEGYIDKYLNDKNALLNFLIEEKLFDKASSDSMWGDYCNCLNILFDEEICNPKIVPEYVVDKTMSYGEVFHVIKVIEKRLYGINYRIVVLAKTSYYSTNFITRVIDESMLDYIRYDIDRIILYTKSKNYFLADGLTEKNSNNEIIIDNEIYTQMARNIDELITGNTNVISAAIFNFYKNRVVKFGTFTNKNTLTERQNIINEQYKKLLADGRIIKFGDIQIQMIEDKYIIKLFNDEFIFECKNDFLNIHDNFYDVKNALNLQNAQYNYNDIWENLLKLSIVRRINSAYTRSRSYHKFQTAEFTINGINVIITKEGNRMKINGIFSRVDDVFYILNKLICFKDIEEFNIYLKDVSYIGVEWKKMISSGIIIQLINPFYRIIKKTDEEYNNSNFYMRFSLAWDKEKRTSVYLMLNDKKYLIKYKGKFKKYYNTPSRSLNMKTLKDELTECIEGINDNKILDIVENAIEEAKIVKKRGKELITLAVKDIDAIECEKEINGTMKKGFLITGIKSKNTYFINKITLEVFRWDNGNWNKRCVVSAYDKDRIFEDKLANRLVNIYNEPTYISTLR
jgi:hypothetical protein